MVVRLCDCRSIEDVCQLRRDNYGIGDYWLCFDGFNVGITHQKLGHDPVASVSIPVREFNHLIRHYTKPQRPVRPKPNARPLGRRGSDVPRRPLLEPVLFRPHWNTRCD